MAGLPFFHGKYFTYRKIVYQRFFVGLLLFILAFLVFSIILNIFSGTSHRIEEYEPVFLDINSADSEVVQDGIRTSRRDKNCTYWDCFNVYRCGRGGHNRLTVYIYPLKKYINEEGAPVSTFSKEFYYLLLAIKRSKYYTPNPEEACLLVPSIDVLNQHTFSSEHISKALYKLKYWNNGENHIIFNMLPGSAPNFNTVVELDTGKAIIAGAGFDTWTYRHGFDIPIPIYSEIATKINNTQPKQKKFLITSSQKNIPDDYLDLLKNLALSSSDFLLLRKCENEVCDYRTSKQYKYPDVLKDSVFCLVTRSARLTQTILLDILASQCIPIVVADSIVMPYSYQIDWSKFTLFVPEENLKSILSIVKSVSSERRTEMFWQLRWVFDKYFSSIERIVLTALDVLNEKVFPLSAKMYEVWNLPEYLYGPQNPLFLPVIAPKSPGFTAVILTYDRVESLFTLIKRLVRTPSLVKIIVVWNNQLKPPPSQSEWPIINRPLKVIQTKENKLSNRFFPYDEIETECQLTIDDDIVMLTPDELEFGFDVWREFPDRIVGFPSRLHVWDNVTCSWKYNSEWTNQISMVLTGAAFHHKIWSWYYTYKMPNAILKWVDDNFNCEDIAMNFLVANVTRKAPIKVTPRKKFKCPECTNTEMLSADATHMSQRSYCINYFAKVYGHLPLKTVEFRADPLQYLDSDGGIPLRYPDIGAL